MALKVDTIQNPSSTVINLTLDTSGNVTVGNNLTTTGATSIANLTYTGTLTGSTGILNIGSGQLYKDASGNVGIGTSSPSYKLSVSGTSVGGAVWANVNNTDTTAGSYAGYFASNGSVNAVMYSSSNGGTGTYGMTTNHPMIFVTNNTERMRIDTSGNVGIGTSSPALKTTIEANGGQLRIRNTTTRYRSDYAVDSAGTSSLVTYDDTGAVFKQMNIYASPLTFNTTSAGAETMRIDASGNLMVNTATASAKLTVVQSAVAIGAYVQSSTATAGYHGVYAEATTSYGVYGKTSSASYGGTIGFNNNNTAFGILGYSIYGLYTNSSINVNGTVYASDGRLKENQVPITGALEKLSLLKPVSFDWKASSSRGISMGNVPVSDFGLIAQEVETVMPEVVFESTTPARTRENTNPLSLEEELGSYKGVDYSRFIPFLIAAVKELSAKVAALEAKK